MVPNSLAEQWCPKLSDSVLALRAKTKHITFAETQFNKKDSDSEHKMDVFSKSISTLKGELLA